MKSILVVCEGNICRSPMGEALLAHALPHLQVSSAGLGALVGHPADETATRLMVEKGIDIAAHRARQITREMCLRADLVLVMDAGQRKRIEDLYPQACGRVFRMGEFTKQDIPDPYRRSEGAFRQSLSLLEAGIYEWLPRIQKISQARA